MVGTVVDCVHGLNSSVLPYPYPLPSDFAVCPIKEEESIFLPLGFEFGYVTRSGRWNIRGSEAWRANQKLGKYLKMRLIFLCLYYCRERYMPGLTVRPQEEEDERRGEELYHHSQVPARPASP